MSQTKNVNAVITMGDYAAADWKPIINGFNVIFRVALSSLLSEGLNGTYFDLFIFHRA